MGSGELDNEILEKKPVAGATPLRSPGRGTDRSSSSLRAVIAGRFGSVERLEDAGEVGGEPVVAPATESDGGSDLAELTLHELTERVRASHAATRSACATALHYAMDTGDALIEGESRRLPIPWGKWVAGKDTCHVSLRTAYLYMQLAKARPRLETAIKEKPDLSIRGAAKLIAVKRNGASKPQAPFGSSLVKSTTNVPPTPSKLADLWSVASPEEKREALAQEDRDSVTKFAPLALLAELRDHALAQLINTAPSTRNSNLRVTLTNIFRLAIGATTPEAAVNALAGFKRKCEGSNIDPHDVLITFPRKCTRAR